MIRVSRPAFLFMLQAVAVVKAVWVPPRTVLHENVDYTQQKSVGQIYSDFDDGTGNIHYFLEGAGANQNPFNVFVIDHESGLIRLTKVLDREEIPLYTLSGVAKYRDGTLAEKNLHIRFKIVDENDNAPVFGIIEPGQVRELSPAGTSVMKIIATDADEEGNENSQIAFSIVDQKPAGEMFYISNDGTIYVKNSLDREKADQYTLTVGCSDLNGKPGGNLVTNNVVINILDVNDNPPTLEKDQYHCSIEENALGVEVMRFKVTDLDLINTDNWRAVFNIEKGNEAGYFSIRTDPNTNEGIIILDKAVNYEDVKNLELGITVRNKAPPFFVGSGGGSSWGGSWSGGSSWGGSWSGGSSWGGSWSGGSSWEKEIILKTYPIKIEVKNQPEGAVFNPKVKAIPISEGGDSINLNDVITYYTAIDEDTGKPAENVRYIKGSDPGNWISIDPETAAIKLNKMPDRESTLLVNGTYFAEVLAISEDIPSKTATGTIAIQVEDFNDHCPTLTSDLQTMCTTSDSVIVNAEDEDVFPNGAPFEFSIIPEGTEGKWQVEHLNDTAAILRAQEDFWPGFYEVELLVKDEQGLSCPEPQKVKVKVCTCEDGELCGKRGARGQITKGSELGPAGIGLLILGLLLLLLIPLLLLFCQCGGSTGLPGGFTEMPFDTKSHLINYHTEGQGETTEMSLVNLPTQFDGDGVKLATSTAGRTTATAPMAIFDTYKSAASMDVMSRPPYEEGFSSSHREGTWGRMSHPSGSGFYSEFHGRESTEGGGIFNGMALPDHFLRQYYGQKVACENHDVGVKDSLLVYDYEGQDSPAGSVGCCSLLESDNDLQFLNDLGPKFKTLAEVCGGKKIPTEVKKLPTPLPSASLNTQSSVSTAVTTQQLLSPPQLQPTSVFRETSESSRFVKEGMATVKQGVTGGVANQGQMLLLQQQQQPVYLASTPVLQPMQYVVQPQVQNTMLLAEAPATNLQGMVLVNGTQTIPAQNLVVQGQTVLSKGQAQGPGMMLVETSGIQGGGSNLIHTGNLSGAQPMMIVEAKVPTGTMKVLKGSQTCLVQGGTLQPGGISGSQRVLVVGDPVSSGGQMVQEVGGLHQKSDISGSQRVHHSKGNRSAGSQSNVMTSSTTTVSKTPTLRKVVVQETREIL